MNTQQLQAQPVKAQQAPRGAPRPALAEGGGMQKVRIVTGALASLPPKALIEDRFGDRAVHLKDGMWLYPETGPLTTEYVAKHYAPFSLVTLNPGSTFTWPEEAMSVPVGGLVESSLKRRYRKVTDDGWAQLRAENRVISTKELTSERLVYTVLP